MFHDVTQIEPFECREEFFNKTFIRHLAVCTGETPRRNEREHALHESFANYRFNVTRYRGDWRMYEDRAIKYLTNLKNRMNMNLKRFMIRSVFAMRPGLSRTGMWAIIDAITNDSRDEQEIEFVDKKASRRRTKEASVTRAAIQEHCAVLGLASPAESISELKKMRKDTIASSCDLSCFWTENSNARRR
jgi:hypothetical protein